LRVAEALGPYLIPGQELRQRLDVERMFLTARVEEIEATDEWKAWEDGYRRRSAANGRKKAEAEKAAPKVQLGQGRDGSYPVVRR
jgi:hypothetical protein